MPSRWDVTRAVRASDLPSPSRLVMLVLADVAEVGTAEIPEQFTPSLSVLVRETGLCQRTVQRHLTELEMAGWISRIRPATAQAMWAGERVRYRLCVPDGLGLQLPQAGATPAPGVGQESRGGGATVTPLETDLSDQNLSSTSEKSPTDERADVEKVCRHLADKIVANGSRRPLVTARWRTEARLLLDKDGRTVAQVIKAIDWCQADPFWRANVLSMPTLREKYDQLRLAAQRNGHARASPASTAPEAIPPELRCAEHPDQPADACRHCRARSLAKPRGPR